MLPNAGENEDTGSIVDEFLSECMNNATEDFCLSSLFHCLTHMKWTHLSMISSCFRMGTIPSAMSNQNEKDTLMIFKRASQCGKAVTKKLCFNKYKKFNVAMPNERSFLHHVNI